MSFVNIQTLLPRRVSGELCFRLCYRGGFQVSFVSDFAPEEGFRSALFQTLLPRRVSGQLCFRLCYRGGFQVSFVNIQTLLPRRVSGQLCFVLMTEYFFRFFDKLKKR